MNAKGLATGGSNVTYLTGITSGQVTTALGYTPSTPVVSTAGTYNNVTINSAGQVTGGSNVTYLTSITSGQIATALGYTPANLASPALTGTPTAPTATLGTNTTQVATTAFVQSALATVSAGTSSSNLYVSASGDVTGSGTSSAGTLSLPLSISPTGTFIKSMMTYMRSFAAAHG